MNSSYNRLGKFILILFISFFVVRFPLICEESLVGEKVESFTEDSHIDITKESNNGRSYLYEEE